MFEIVLQWYPTSRIDKIFAGLPTMDSKEETCLCQAQACYIWIFKTFKTANTWKTPDREWGAR